MLSLYVPPMLQGLGQVVILKQFRCLLPFVACYTVYIASNTQITHKSAIPYLALKSQRLEIFDLCVFHQTTPSGPLIRGENLFQFRFFFRYSPRKVETSSSVILKMSRDNLETDTKYFNTWIKGPDGVDWWKSRVTVPWMSTVIPPKMTDYQLYDDVWLRIGAMSQDNMAKLMTPSSLTLRRPLSSPLFCVNFHFLP